MASRTRFWHSTNWATECSNMLFSRFTYNSKSQMSRKSQCVRKAQCIEHLSVFQSPRHMPIYNTAVKIYNRIFVTDIRQHTFRMMQYQTKDYTFTDTIAHAVHRHLFILQEHLQIFAWLVLCTDDAIMRLEDGIIDLIVFILCTFWNDIAITFTHIP